MADHRTILERDRGSEMIGIPVKPDFKRKYKLGTRKVDELGHKAKYAKIDFGIVGVDPETGKKYRNICYTWVYYK